MRKLFRKVSLFLVVSVFLISAPLIYTDIGTSHNYLGNGKKAKINIEEFSLTQYSVIFNNSGNRSAYKPDNITHLGTFKVQIPEFYNPIIILSNTNIKLDLRKKIRELLGNHFHGSRYTSNSLFI